MWQLSILPVASLSSNTLPLGHETPSLRIPTSVFPDVLYFRTSSIPDLSAFVPSP